MKVDIVVLTYNSENYIGLCIDRIHKNTPTKSYTLTVIDNGSTDTSSKWADIINKENIGCGPARNQGARLGKSEYICFIDSDLLVHPGWLDAFLEVFRSEDTGLVGAQLYNEYGAFYGLSPGFIPGAFTMMKRSLFEELGGFDEGMFFGYEDTDMCMKILKKGKKVRVANTKALHFGSLSINPTPELREEIEKSRMLFNKKWRVNLPSYLEKGINNV